MSGHLTPTQVSRLHPHLGKPRTIQRWVALGWVECYRTPGGHIRFSEEQVTKLLEFQPVREHHPEVHIPNPLYAGNRLQLVKGAPPKRRAS